MAPERGFRLIRQFVEKQPIYAKSWAICVGSNEYQGGQGRLTNAVNDAKAVAEILRNTHGFEEVYTLKAPQKFCGAVLSQIRFGKQESFVFHLTQAHVCDLQFLFRRFLALLDKGVQHKDLWIFHLGTAVFDTNSPRFGIRKKKLYYVMSFLLHKKSASA